MWTRFAVLSAVLCAALAAQSEIDIRNGVFRDRPVTYRVIDGLAILEGDIILGAAAEMESASAFSSSQPAPSGRAILTPDTRLRWTNATIPYRVDADVPNPQRIQDAVAFWNANTPIHLTPWAGETNRLRFIREQNFGICFSSVGMVGGEQTIRVDDGCTSGGLIHEIGHTVGLYHEQSRVDRDRYVTMNLENVNKTLINNFNQNFGAAEAGPYDYGSIMGYSRFSDAWDPLIPTMETTPPGMPIGLLTVLSPEEIVVVKQMYGQAPKSTLISSNPAGLTILVDGAPVATPQSFAWSAGETHTVEAPGPQGDDTLRYVFGRWSDDGDAAHTITVGDGLSIYNASFIQQFPLKTGVNGNGTLTVDPSSDSGFYANGSVITLTATPADGYWFRSYSGFISVIEGPAANPAKLRLNFTGANYVANFIPRAPTIVTTDPPGLTVTVDGSNFASPRGFDYAAGSTHTIAVQSPIAPRAGVRYVFQKWSDGGALSHTVTAGVPATYTAIFTAQYQITSNTAGISGSVTMAPPSSDGFYNAGTAVQVTAKPSGGFALANWIGDFTGVTASQPIVMNDQQMVTANFVSAGALNFNSVVHAATLQPGAVAPGQQVTIFGSAIGPDSAVSFPLGTGASPDTILGGTRLLFDGVPAAMLLASAGRVTAVVPAVVAGHRTTTIQLEVNGKRSGSVVAGVLDTHPGLFTTDGSGSGPAQAFNEDGSPNSAANPAASGSVISLLVTGAGLADASGAPVAPVRAQIGGKDADLVYAGPADGQPPGVVRIDARIPDGTATGAAAMRIFCGYTPSPAGTTISVQ